MVADNFQNSSFNPSSFSGPAAPQPPRRRLSARLAAAFVAVVLAGGVASGAATTTFLNSRGKAPSSVAGTTVSTSTKASSSGGLSATTIYAQASPGVVTITSRVQGRFGSSGTGTGSGLVLNTSGDIVTNAHVVSGAQQVQVTFSDGQTAAATLVGINSSADLAVIHVSVAGGSLHPVTLGNSNGLLVGDTVYAIGAPFGLSESLTAGIVSGLHRANTGGGSSIPSNLIQVDAAINPGNSGGALLNTAGQVIGINESIESPVDGNVGVGFAIPSNTVIQMLPSLESGSNT